MYNLLLLDFQLILKFILSIHKIKYIKKKKIIMEFLAEDNVCGQSLLLLVARGSAILAEM